MATATLPITGAWWGDGGTGGWRETEYIWSGKDGANYRSKIAISTAGMTISGSTKLVLELQLNRVSSPFCLEGILTQNNTIPTNDCQNSAAGAASDTLNAAALSRSFAYKDEACTTLLTMADGVNMAAASKIYLRFDIADIKQDQTYYVYFIRNLRDGYNGSGWVEAAVAAIVPTLEYTSYTACTAPTWMTVTPAVYEDIVRLEWGGAEAGIGNPITGYQIWGNFSEDKVNWSGWIDFGTTTDTFKELSPAAGRGGFVSFSVRTLGEAGEEYYSEWYISEECITQKNRAPYAPADVTANALIVSGGVVTLRWSAAEDPDGHLVGYIVGREIDGRWTELDNGMNLSFSEVRNGDPGEVIRYAVCACDQLRARSDWVFSNEITFNTPPSAPTKATLDKEEYSPGESVTLSWSGADDVDGNLSGFDIVCIKEETGEQIPLAQVQTSDTGGRYVFIPDQLDYQQTMRLAICSRDDLDTVSAYIYTNALRRNDRPHAHIFENGIPGNYVPVISDGRYMPYVRMNGEWVRHPGER